jgi:hypothetical protein
MGPTAGVELSTASLECGVHQSVSLLIECPVAAWLIPLGIASFVCRPNATSADLTLVCGSAASVP